jgi:hypothetical protein
MLRAVVGLCFAVALCGLWSQRLSDRDFPSGYCPSPISSWSASTPRAVLVEHDLDVEHGHLATHLPAIESPHEPAAGHLATRRMDRDTTYLELLLTCGRLLI